MFPILKVMFLGLVRDRGALAMSFLLPPVIFLIFASVFAGAGGGDLRIKLVLSDAAKVQASRDIVGRLVAVSAIQRVGAEGPSEADAELMVRRGEADVGLIVRTDDKGVLSFLILQDPTRKVAASVLSGHLRNAIRGPVPPSAAAAAPAISTRSVIAGTESQGTIAYYAGAVAILFLLFAAVQNAATLQEDRESGIFDRIVIGPQGIGALISGKFLFIVLLGLAQVTEIFVAAWLIYGVSLPANVLAWFGTTLCAAISAAGLCMLLAALCTSRRQAQTLGNFLVLIISAVGGSMIPRYLMPDWLQTVGWLTPNAWALDAYTGTFWRGEELTDLTTAWIVLVTVGVVSLIGAHIFGRRFEKI